MGRQTKELCRVIAACVERGELTAQQGRTLAGQAKHGDREAALRGLARLYRREYRDGR